MKKKKTKMYQLIYKHETLCEIRADQFKQLNFTRINRNAFIINICMCAEETFKYDVCKTMAYQFERHLTINHRLAIIIILQYNVPKLTKHLHIYCIICQYLNRIKTQLTFGFYVP